MTDLAVQHTEAQLVERLTALAACDGREKLAVKRLAENGTTVTAGELEVLREQHVGMYQAIAAERSSQAEEIIAQNFREIVSGAQRVTRAFVTELADAIDEGGLDGLPADIRRQLPQTVQALTKVQQVGVDKLLTITGRPSDGGGGDPLAAAKILMDLGVLSPVARPQVDADSTATES